MMVMVGAVFAIKQALDSPGARPAVVASVSGSADAIKAETAADGVLSKVHAYARSNEAATAAEYNLEKQTSAGKAQLAAIDMNEARAELAKNDKEMQEAIAQLAKTDERAANAMRQFSRYAGSVIFEYHSAEKYRGWSALETKELFSECLRVCYKITAREVLKGGYEAEVVARMGTERIETSERLMRNYK